MKPDRNYDFSVAIARGAPAAANITLTHENPRRDSSSYRDSGLNY